MTDYVLVGLVKRRADLAGEANALKARIGQISTDIEHLDAVIRLFDPDYNLAAIRPKRPRGPDMAKRGEISRFILGALRDAPEPMTVAAIVQRWLTERGADVADGTLASVMAKRVAMTLRHQVKAGAVRSVREPGRVAFWDIVR